MREIKRKVERRLCLLNGPTRMGAPIKEKKGVFLERNISDDDGI